MDSTLILWGFCILGAMIGLKSNLFGGIIFMWNMTFGLYLAIWNYPLINSFVVEMFPAALAPWKSTIIILGVFAIVVGALSSIKNSILKDKELLVNFPSLVNYIGGLICGSISGTLLGILILLAYGLSPLCNSISVDHGQCNAKLIVHSTVKFTNIVNGFSLQPKISQREELLLEDLLKIAKESAKEEKKTSSKKTKVKVAEKAISSKAIDLVEKQEKIEEKAISQKDIVLVEEQEKIEEKVLIIKSNILEDNKEKIEKKVPSKEIKVLLEHQEEIGNI